MENSLFLKPAHEIPLRGMLLLRNVNCLRHMKSMIYLDYTRHGRRLFTTFLDEKKTTNTTFWDEKSVTHTTFWDEKLASPLINDYNGCIEIALGVMICDEK